MKKSRWYNINVCTKCEKRLSHLDLINSSGTCPYCGNTSIGTICDYRKVILRSVKHYEWWQIFGGKTTYEGGDEYSKSWINRF
ncbi:hypothetical protein Nekkels1_60 [Cellulophaga phage Nekkels_1]|uniref:Uncharacterized protein n=1 Tax=Cellulophaga phage Nekkels_1 TaxID=2745692 RepID=A0A8E4UXH9_9CAUD|nr:hypothetical protein M1M31_gp60 [Cellulophaga phage Nekkels_1]QQO97064.1 hypothetical protein Nekkels1_60 [Cellulophaga phage Nekkels_1]QQO97157.1 hypothetical protein Nekkels2_60 [Cellulophaga phage Nekkels_2]